MTSTQLEVVGARFLRVRPWVVGVMLLASFGVLRNSDVPPDQLKMIAMNALIALSFFFGESIYFSRHRLNSSWLVTSLMVTLVGISITCVMSGGLDSPFLPMMLAPAAIGLAAFGRSIYGTVLVLMLIVLTFALFLLPASMPFDPLPQHAHRLISWFCVLDVAVLLSIGVAGLSDAYKQTGATLERTGDSLVYAARLRAFRLDSLAGKVAHEVKKPLAAILGLLQVMQESLPDERNQKRIAVAISEAQRIETTLQTYLSEARVVDLDNQTEKSEISFGLNELVKDIVNILEGKASRSEVSLVASPCNIALRGDPLQWKETLMNLLQNAIDASFAGGTVKLSCSNDPKNQNVFYLVIEDFGRGLSEEQLKQLGTAYFTTKPNGTGLGFLLAKQFIVEQGGQIVVESEKERGTKITIVLPVKLMTKHEV